MKIPVQKTVVRNGQQHTQTYWEEDDKHASQPSLLAGLGAPRLQQQKNSPKRPVDPALEQEWAGIPEDIFSPDDAEAAIAAGLTVNAAAAMQSGLPEWTSLSDHIYENNMDELPRPKGGWKNKDGHRSTDQRWAWENAEIPLETAVEWIDAGFETAWSGLANIIRAGVPLERAIQWEEDYCAETGRFDGARLHLAYAEMTSDMTLEQAFEYRRAFHGDTRTRCGWKEIDYFNKGIPASAAAVWNKAVYDDVKINEIVSLRDLGWSSAKCKRFIKETTGRSGTYARVSSELAFQMIRSTEAVGSAKLVVEWAATASRETYNNDELFPPHVVRGVHEAEAFKSRVAKETGIKLNPEHNRDLLLLMPLQREAFLDLLKDGDRGFTPEDENHITKTMELARYIASSENLQVLRDHGFEFGNPVTKEPHVISFDSGTSHLFDAASADEHSRNKWMKELAFRLYSKKVRQQPERDRWTEDDSIDPVQLKDILLNDPQVDDVRIDALLVGNIAAPVAEGWL